MTAFAISVVLALFLCWWVWQLRRWDAGDKPASMIPGSPEGASRDG